jgi:superfamily II DNA/RNA helicase
MFRVWPATRTSALRDLCKGRSTRGTPHKYMNTENSTSADLVQDDLEPIAVLEAAEPLAPRAPVKPDSPTFAELGARPETVDALAAVGITHSFAIQEYALPIGIRGTDMIGQAPTGTGKTLGFGIPLLERVLAPSEGADGRPQALVVVPTRELGIQVARDIKTAGGTRGVRVMAIYGGVAYEPQTEALSKGIEIIVGTPGRLLDLAKSKQLNLGAVKALVLDEADRMLDLGFLDDVEKILAMVPVDRQTMLFSATMPDPISTMARRFMRNPVTVHAGHSAETGPSPQTQQVIYRTHSLNKLEIVARILQADGRGLTMIFTRTKRNADRVAEDLDFRGFASAAVHGDLNQGARERALRAFRAGKIDVLVATDVAARGLDVSGVTHVINYDCPEDPDTYTHRIGRTGRAGATGVAVTFVDWEDMPRWQLIDKTLGMDLPEPPETYHTSPWLYTDLAISTEVSSTLPTADRTRAGLSAEKEEDLGGGRMRDRGASSRGRSAGGPGGRSSAPRSGRGGGRSGPRRDEGTEVTAVAADEAQRAPRQRRRGRRVDADGAPTAEIDTETGTSTSTASPDETTSKPRRRRRRSGGSGRDAAATTSSEATPEA